MKRKLHSFVKIIIAFLTLINFQSVNAQCTWHWYLYDNYEYTTVIPGIIPGTLNHNSPQTFVAHGGTRSMYMNFINGVPSGTLVYERPVLVCPNVPIRISSWLTTSFSGVQCNVKLVVTDANDVVLDSVPSLVADYAPIWTHYQTPSITPTTASVKFKLYTNVAGSAGGNDLSMDDFLVEQCNDLNLGSDTTVCNTQSVTLDAGSSFISYLWNNNSIGQTLLASTSLPGTTTSTYFVTAENSDHCYFKDTVKVTFTVCSAVPEINDQNQLIFPNPATDKISITISQNISTLALYDLIGNKVKVFTDRNNIFVGDCSKGIYLMCIETDKGQRILKKVLIN